MALTITAGPADWSISATNGKDTANFIWGGHPTFRENKEYYVRYVAKRNGEVVDPMGWTAEKSLDIQYNVPYIVNHCCYTPEHEGSIHNDGEQLLHLFKEGSWTVQMFYCRNNETRILTDEDRTYLDRGEKPPDWVGEEILETSNIWSWEVTA